MNEKVLPEKLMNSVLGKLYDILANGDGDVVAPSDDNYLAWLSVGMPYPAKEMDFLSEGLTGVYRKKRKISRNEDGTTTNEQEELSQDELNQLLAQDSTRKYQQAENFARLADFIPDTAHVKGDVTMNVWNPENTLSQAYYQILKFSQVADIQPDEKTKAKIKRLRGLLQTTKMKKDLITEEEVEVTQESELVKKYNEKLANYLNVALEYNTHRVNALAAKDPSAVHYWAMNAPLLRNKVMAAKNDWITNGYKEEYEQIAAYIAQVEGRSMVALKAQYLDDLEKSELTGLASGADFYYSSLLPGNFARRDEGWTEFTFTSSDLRSSYQFDSSKASAGGGLALGFVNVGGGGSHQQEKSKRKFDASNFKLRFKIAQVPIVRPWFNTNFLTSKYWRFDGSNPEFDGQMVSDGKKPPNGMIPAYTTTAIFIKDLNLHFGEYHSEFEQESKKTSGGGFVSWGPLHLGGSYEKQSGSSDFESSSDTQGIKVKGMQLIGFKCHVLPKSPNPNRAIQDWV